MKTLNGDILGQNFKYKMFGVPSLQIKMDL